MWTPTHCKVTIHRAKNLVSRGGKGTTDAYVTIQLGKEKYQTSVVEKSDAPVWDEECDLPVVNLYSTLSLNVYNRVMLGIDEFLGNVTVNLSDFPVYECAKSRSYSLQNKPGKKPWGYHGELDARVTFVVLNKNKSKSSDQKRSRTYSVDHVRQVASNVGGKLQRSLSGSNSHNSSKKQPEPLVEPFMKHDLHDIPYHDDEAFLNNDSRSMTIAGAFSKSNGSQTDTNNVFTIAPQKECPAPRQPTSFLRALSDSTMKKKGSEGTDVPLLAGEGEEQPKSEAKDDGATPLLQGIMDNSDMGGITMSVNELSLSLGESKMLVKPPTPTEKRRSLKRCQEVPKNERRYTLTGELPTVDAFQLMSWEDYDKKRKEEEKEGLERIKKEYQDKDQDELVRVIHCTQSQLDRNAHYIRDLENYLDILLVRVMATSPRILENPYDGPGAV